MTRNNRRNPTALEKLAESNPELAARVQADLSERPEPDFAPDLDDTLTIIQPGDDHYGCGGPCDTSDNT